MVKFGINASRVHPYNLSFLTFEFLESNIHTLSILTRLFIVLEENSIDAEIMTNSIIKIHTKKSNLIELIKDNFNMDIVEVIDLDE
jgi:hypothetical protein